jgi:DnaJ-class molecular chaperone
MDNNSNLKVINDVKIEPKKIPFRCPVCNGFGSLKYGEKICQACKGLGYVIINQKDGQDGTNPTT